MNNVRYNIYPSLLDKYQRFLDSEKEFESHWNIDADGEYKKTLDEIYEANEQALIDAINRVPLEGDTTAMDKGTCFNEIIDCIVNNKPYISSYISCESIKDRGIIVAKMMDDEGDVVKEFIYDMKLCKMMASYYHGAVTQCYCEAILHTTLGDVKLYGYADIYLHDKVIDIKTCKSYTFGDYENRWQRYVYPYCITEQGGDVNRFSFDVVKWSGGTQTNPVLSGDIYEEVYGYNHAEATRKLREMVTCFIAWLETKRLDITDKKIFNE